MRRKRSMKKNCSKVISGVFGLSILLLLALPSALFAVAAADVPVKGMVTMVDLGAKKCIPCKMMAPILEKLERVYAARAAVVFFDVWEDPAPAKRFGIRTIPTQIFFDKDGKEVYRHEGFLSEEEIVRRFKEMGVKEK
jgi:thioredoxin 1